MFPLRLWIESFFAFFFFFLALMASVSSWCSLDYRHIIPVSTSILIWSFFLISLYCQLIRTSLNFLGSSDGKESACIAETWVQSLGLWYSCLENSIDRGTWQATVHGVTKSQTWLSDVYMINKYTRTALYWIKGPLYYSKILTSYIHSGLFPKQVMFWGIRVKTLTYILRGCITDKEHILISKLQTCHHFLPSSLSVTFQEYRL